MSSMETDFVRLVQGDSNVERGKARLGGAVILETVPFIGETSQGKVRGGELKEFAALQVKGIDEKSRRITALASASSLDRDNEIIEPGAFKKWLPVYMKNPIVIAGHQHRLDTGLSSVIANTVKAWVDKNGLWAIIEFHDITPLAEQYWQLYSLRKQRAFSVGFIPHAWEYGQDGDKRVKVFTEVELLEISCVVVPSNREALSRSKQRKAEFIAAKKTERVDDKFLAEIRADNPDFDEQCSEFAEALLYGDEITGEGAGQTPAKQPPVLSGGQPKLAALLLKTDRELAHIFGIKGMYQRYLKFKQAVAHDDFGLDELELYKAVESGDIDVFGAVVAGKVEAIAGNAEPDYVAIVSGVG